MMNGVMEGVMASEWRLADCPLDQRLAEMKDEGVENERPHSEQAGQYKTEKAVSVPHPTGTLQLDDLPPELCRMVSKAWKKKASDPLLVHKFHAVIQMVMTEERILKEVSSKPSLLTMTVDGRQLTDKILEAAWEHPTLETLRVEETEGVNYEYDKVDIGHVYTMVWSKALFSCQHAEIGRRWNDRWSRSRRPKPQTTLTVCAKPGSEVVRLFDQVYKVLRRKM